MAAELVTQVQQGKQPSAKDAKRQAQQQEGSCWSWLCCRSPPSPQQQRANGAQGGPICLLPPLREGYRGRKCLVLDLDETLVHSSFKPIPDPDFTIDIELEGNIHRVYVRKRPGVDHFLEEVGKKFEVVIFTASLAKYADPLLDILDPHRVCVARLFREACVQHYGNYVKDLTHLGRRLQDTIIVDNSPFSYMFQPDNAIPIVSWFQDKNDRQLYELLPFLDSMVDVDDVAALLSRRSINNFGGEEHGQ
jgi:RNA polymerase II subunit A small phosphatase-like protein